MTGARERDHSPWLGRPGVPSREFLQFQALERAVLSQWPTPLAAISPATALGACADWAVHLASSPAKQWELLSLAGAHWSAFVLGAAGRAHPSAWWRALVDGPAAGDPGVSPLPQDKRFSDAAWREPPFAAWAQAFLRCQDWWQQATTAVPGVSRHHEQMVQFAARQWLDMAAPSNTLGNPAVMRQTLSECGANLVRGLLNAADDARRDMAGLPPPGAERFQPGIGVAVTPGRVVFRNRLMELIQYGASTATVHPEPILIVPAWIMKYYVLDQEPRNSLVKYLVDRGHTVFAISWKNPGTAERDLGMDDYDRLGLRAALAAISKALPGSPVHGVGYCLGGTLLAITAAALGRHKPQAFKTLTLLAAQTDFTEPGELSLFIDESQINWLEQQMARRGYLDKRQMAASFQMLRSRDLVWSYRLGAYLMGARAPLTAMAAWNADGTRLPARMHSEYLRSLYLGNTLARGAYKLDGVPVSLDDVRIPVFFVGAVQDHVSPWRSVFKLHQFSDADKTFALTTGGHNVGIVNPPGDPRSSYRLRHWRRGERLLTPDEWLDQTESVAGSWWVPWAAWLARHSSARVPAPRLRDTLPPAPGAYVLER